MCLHIIAELHSTMCIEINSTAEDDFSGAFSFGYAILQGKHVPPEDAGIYHSNCEYGWEVFEGPSDSVCDRIVRSPDTGEMLSIQIKYISKDTSHVETYSTGSGTMKGGKRKRTNYAKHNIDYIMAVNPHTEQYYLYPKEYYENYSSLTPSRHPGVSIPTVEKTLEEIRKTRHKDHLATLDSVYHD